MKEVYECKEFYVFIQDFSFSSGLITLHHSAVISFHSHFKAIILANTAVESTCFPGDFECIFLFDQSCFNLSYVLVVYFIYIYLTFFSTLSLPCR